MSKKEKNPMMNQEVIKAIRHLLDKDSLTPQEGAIAAHYVNKGLHENAKTTMPYALMGYTAEQCAAAEYLTNQIKEQRKKQAHEEFMERLRLAEAKFRNVNLAKKFFKRHPRNPQAIIEIDEPTIIVLGNLWKADLTTENFHSEDFDGIDIPMDIILSGQIALPDVEIKFPLYLECATGSELGYNIEDRAEVVSARFIMKEDYLETIQNSTNQQKVFADVIMTFKGKDAHGRNYEFTMGTELMIDAENETHPFFNEQLALKGRVPGKLMSFMVERLLVYYTAVWYSIMLAYLHPLTITSIVDVGKRMMEQYSHEPTKYKAPLKNIRYLKLDGDTLEKVLYHSKPGKGRKYERHCQLWYVRGYMRKGKWIAPQWRGPLAKMKRLSDDIIEARQRKIVGVSIDKNNE